MSKSVQERIDAAIAKCPQVATILADLVHGGWEGNEWGVDAIVGDDATLRAEIKRYSAAVKYAGDPRYFEKNASEWLNLLCVEQMKRASGGRCDALTEYRCEVWKASFAKDGGVVGFNCGGCERGIAHETEMQERAGYNLPVYTPIDGQTGGQ